jgi:hypothetical protein
MSTGEPVSGPSLLADLESRQDELLRLLAELEARTEQALAALGVNVASTPAAAVPIAPPLDAPSPPRRKAA